MRIFSVLTAILTAFIISSAYVQGHDQGALTDSLPEYVRIVVDYDAESQLPDSTFYKISGKTIFKVNSTKINLNDPFLKELAKDVLPYANTNELMLVGIDMRGAASPEGPYHNNVRLSKGRAAALKKFIFDRLDSVQINNIRTRTIAEDYIYLVMAMEKAHDHDTEVVRGIVEKYGLDNPAAIKRSLRSYNGGRLWVRLLNTYFPDLRAARVVLYFKPLHPVPDMVKSCTTQPVPMMPALTIEPLGLPKYVRRERLPLERRHVLGVSSNLLYDAFYMPNFGWAPMPNISLEYFPPSGNFTFRLGFMAPYYHRWSKHKFFQIRDYHLEVRRYFNPGFYHTGLYLGAYANTNVYGIGLNKHKGWQGEGYGGALKIGYVLPLANKRLRLDFHFAAGAYISRYDPYVYGNPIDGIEDGDYYYDWVHGADKFHRRNYRLTWLGPTEVGVTLSFDFLYRRIFGNGVSFNRFTFLP